MRREPANRTSQSATFAVLAAALGALASCASLSGGARDSFARIAKCSPDQVSVVSRPDLPPPAPSASAETPPPARHGHKRFHLPSADSEPADKCDMFEATGCGQRLTLCCEHPWAKDSSGSRVRSNQKVECSEPSASPPAEADAGPDAPPPPPAATAP